MSEFHDILSNIVYSREKSPTIINPDSNFVVVTYWWGNTNQNNNYELLLNSQFLFDNFFPFEHNEIIENFQKPDLI